MRGGQRLGSGRPNVGRPHTITVRISEESYTILSTLNCSQSEYIDKLIKMNAASNL